MYEPDVVRSLAALAQTVRLRLYRSLVVAGTHGLTPGAMADEISVTAATLSFHLKELCHAGLITQERQGRHLVYRASFTAMNELLGYLTDNCCMGEACMPTQSTTPCKDPS
jgi:ArsR family transcriptional regulator